MISYKNKGSFHFLKIGRLSVQIVRAKSAAPLADARFTIGADALVMTGAAVFCLSGIASAILTVFA